MKITEYRTKELLHWLDDTAADRTLLFEEMTMYRDAAALIRQQQAAEQAAWHAGLDAGREQGRGKDHAHQPPSGWEVNMGVQVRDGAWVGTFAEWCRRKQTAPPSAPVRVYAKEVLQRVMVTKYRDGSIHVADRTQQADFDTWKKNPYTKVLMKSIDAEHDQQLAAEIEALRVEVAAQRTRADAMTGEAIKHEARAERLAEALQKLIDHGMTTTADLDMARAALHPTAAQEEAQ